MATETRSARKPFFSIIIPCRNNADVIGRAIKSCLSQDFKNFEVIVVDGASTDGTLSVINQFTDPRITLICEENGRGVCPARNTGVNAARSDWLIFLDGDNELLPGALDLIHKKATEASDDIDHLKFCCQVGYNEDMIAVQLLDEIWDYDDYVCFRERIAGSISETLCCIRSRTFSRVRWPDDRSFETLYHLDFSKNFKIHTFPEVAMIYHIDSETQNTFNADPSHLLNIAPSNANCMDAVLLHHGEVLKKNAPRAYLCDIKAASRYHYLSGHFLEGSQYMIRYLCRKPQDLTGWLMMFIGLFGRNAFAYANSVKKIIQKNIFKDRYFRL